MTSPNDHGYHECDYDRGIFQSRMRNSPKTLQNSTRKMETSVVWQKGEPMGCDLYKVTTGSVDVARYMPLDTALILVKALMVEYYNDPELDYTIKRERRTDE